MNCSAATMFNRPLSAQEITAERVTEMLADTYSRATEDRQHSAAARSADLLDKSVGMFHDRPESSHSEVGLTQLVDSLMPILAATMREAGVFVTTDLETKVRAALLRSFGIDQARSTHARAQAM